MHSALPSLPLQFLPDNKAEHEYFPPVVEKNQKRGGVQRKCCNANTTPITVCKPELVFSTESLVYPGIPQSLGLEPVGDFFLAFKIRDPNQGRTPTSHFSDSHKVKAKILQLRTGKFVHWDRNRTRIQLKEHFQILEHLVKASLGNR